MLARYASVFRAGLFTGQAAIVNIIADMWQGMPTMGHSSAARAGMLNFTETAAFISGSCIRVDGAVPNAKRVRDLMNKGKTAAFDGFHLAANPKVLG